MILEKGVSPNVVRVKLDCTKKKEHWFLLLGDQHWDNPNCDRELLKKHLDEALEYDAGILDCGDLFCCMQGRFDKRSSKSDLRPEHQTGDYFDALVRTAADFFEPYAHNIVSLGTGNHEESVNRLHETRITERLAQSLRDRTRATVPVTGYTGWVKFQFVLNGRVQTARTLWHMHGYGGGGPVTVDNIQAQRQNAYIEGADIMWSGHTHDRFAREFCKMGITQDGEVFQRNLWYVKSGSYKNEYRTGKGGWHVETGKPPKPLGGWWLKFTFYIEQVKKVKHVRVMTELIPAN